MIGVKVIDASALAAVLFSEPEGEAVAVRLAGARLVAPHLLAFELANVCLTKCRRRPEQRPLLIAGMAMFQGLDVESVDVDQSAVVRLALATELTAYDSAYLWLACELGAELVTLDRRLHLAALQ